jgi:hypothetical protein
MSGSSTANARRFCAGPVCHVLLRGFALKGLECRAIEGDSSLSETGPAATGDITLDEFTAFMEQRGELWGARRAEHASWQALEMLLNGFIDPASPGHRAVDPVRRIQPDDPVHLSRRAAADQRRPSDAG